MKREKGYLKQEFRAAAPRVQGRHAKVVVALQAKQRLPFELGMK